MPPLDRGIRTLSRRDVLKTAGVLLPIVGSIGFGAAGCHQGVNGPSTFAAFEETSFDPADWDVTAPAELQGGTGTHLESKAFDGSTPFRKQDHTHSGINSTIHVLSRYLPTSTASPNPITRAIDHIDLVEIREVVARAGAGTADGLFVVFQNNVYFTYTLPSLDQAAAGWNTVTANNLKATNFEHRTIGSSVVINPDFSGNGAAIYLGYSRATFINVITGSPVWSLGLKSWKVTVTFAS